MPVAHAISTQTAAPARPAQGTRSARRDRRAERAARHKPRRRAAWTLTSPPLRPDVESLDHWLDLCA
jgi:hypothetical protein